MVNEKVRFLNIDFLSITKKELLKEMHEGVLITPNVDHLIKLQSDKDYYNIVKQAEWVVCDSRVLYLLSRFTKRPFPEAIPGSSFFEDFYQYHASDQNCRIFLLGGLDGVAPKAQDRINKKMGRNMVVGSYSPSYGFEKKDDENDFICDEIIKTHATVVLVGVGCPKQEKWIFEHKNKMPGVKIWMALGATIDFEAGNKSRAPKIFQKLCIEWLYRLCQEPKRMFKRVFVDDIRIFWYFGKQLLKLYKNPFDDGIDC